MKTFLQHSLKAVLAAGCLLFALHAPDVRAAYSCWDPTGATASATPTGSWEGVNWGPLQSTALSANLNLWYETNVLPVFAAGTSATGAYTVTANADHTVAGMFDGGITGSSAGAVTVNGTGTLTISPGQQGFTVASGGSLTIYSTLAGTGQMIPESSGSLSLFGTNTYSGGTSMGYSGSAYTGTINVNNNASFGTGTIIMFTSGNAIAVQPGNTNAITLPNAVTAAAVTLNIVGNPAGLTFGGPWNVAVTPNLSCGTAGNLVIIGGVMSGAGGLNKLGVATLRLTATNTYTGNTTISNGTLALGATGFINTSANIVIAPGANGSIFDVSANSTYTLGGSTTLNAQGTGTATATYAQIKGASGGTVSLGTRPVKLTFTPTVFTGDTTHPPLYISQGALTLNNNTITVTNAAATALGTGTYRLIQVGNGTSGTITGTPNAAVTVLGAGIAAGRVASLVVSNGDVNLVVKPPAVISGVTMTQSNTFGIGATLVTLAGKVSAGAVYPAQNETVSIKINGSARTTTINDTTGDFTYSFNPTNVPYLNTNTIIYTYAGNASLGAGTNTTVMVGNAFFVGGALPFDVGMNLFFTNKAGITMFGWSSTNPSLPVTDWNLEATLQEQPLNDGSGNSRYTLNANPPTNSTVYYICGPSLAWPYLSPTAPQWITTDDSFNYSVYMTNSAITAAGVLDLPAPPVILLPLSSQTNLAGGNASLSALVTGSTPLSYQWFFNNAPISGGVANPLTLTNITTNSAGNYFVVVTNVYGSATSSVAALTVVLPPVITLQPLSQTNLAGKSASFDVTATGTPPLSYKWFFNTNTPVSAGSPNSLLTLASLTTNNTGFYTVVVTNAYASTTSTAASLSVLLPPKMTTQVVSNGFQLSGLSLPGATFEVQMTTNWAFWVNLSTNLVGSDGVVQFTDTNANAGPSHFYRLLFP